MDCSVHAHGDTLIDFILDKTHWNSFILECVVTMAGHGHVLCRFVSMMALSTSLFLVELIVGVITRSLALVGDSYHMLSDVIALIIALVAMIFARRAANPRNTFGWVRAEVLGALLNSVLLLTLCFTISTEAFQRLAQPEVIKHPPMLLAVGVLGLAFNLIGMLLFGGHGHSHGPNLGHGHNQDNDGYEDIDHQTSSRHGHHLVIETQVNAQHSQLREQVPDRSQQLNIKGVFLHFMGDALGSVLVIINALIIWYVSDQHKWKYRIDPILSLLLVVIIAATSIPLFKESAMILLQSVPENLHVDIMKERLLETVDGILSVHELHIWQLTGSKVLASVHLHCACPDQHMVISKKVKDFFHSRGIHSTTVQLEFSSAPGWGQAAPGWEGSDPGIEVTNHPCLLPCATETDCLPMTCCGDQAKDDSIKQ